MRPERRRTLPHEAPRRARVARAIVVVNADAEQRRDWAAGLQSDVTRVLGCAGPLVTCALLRDLASCPLLDEADLAVYDTASLTPGLVPRLALAHPDVPLLFARDERGTDGRHQPVVVAASGPIDRGRVARLASDSARLIPPPPRAISEEEAELEIHDMEHRAAEPM